MANLVKRMPVIIKKLDAAREALAELSDYSDIAERHACDTRVKLSADLREYTDYLEKAKWWRKSS